MKKFEHHVFDYQKCVQELNEFETFLQKAQLDERRDILPFFKKRKQLSAFVGSMASEIAAFDRLAFELDIFGDFSCDLAIGDFGNKAYCFVEFEDAKETSVFHTIHGKDTQEWSPRLEHGTSQIIDWLWLLEDHKHTGKFQRLFGTREIHSIGLVIIGRSSFVDDFERLRWRSSNLRIGKTNVYCYTFDQLFGMLKKKAQIYGLLSENKSN